MSKIEVAVFQESKKGTSHCGDSYFYFESENHFTCAVADGLGSGEFAQESSQIVIDVIKNNLQYSNQQIVKTCNERLAGRRGVVVGVLRLNFMTNQFTFSSIGNIGLIIVAKNLVKKRNIPNRGYLAGYKRTFSVMKGALEKETNFIMYSDGVEDHELSKSFLVYEDVEDIVKTFDLVYGRERFDDTTFIAMRYD